MHGRRALERAAELGIEYVESVAERPVAPAASLDALREPLDLPLPEGPTDAVTVVDELARDVEPGLTQMSGGRYFGFVIGGALPAAMAADWLTSAWDQNTGLALLAPAASVTEEVAGRWVKELLGLPAHASFAFVTGCQMAHATALVAARHHVLAQAGHDVEQNGLVGAPRITVVAGAKRHGTLDRALRFVGLGTSSMRPRRRPGPDAERRAARRARMHDRADDRLLAGRRGEHGRLRRPRGGLRPRAGIRRLASRRRRLRALGGRVGGPAPPHRRCRACRLLGDRRAQVAERPLRQRHRLLRAPGVPPGGARGPLCLSDLRRRGA